MKAASRHNRGFTLVEIMIVVGIIGLLAVIAIPAFVKARIQAQNTAFANDLRIAVQGIEMYTIDNGTYPPDANHGVKPPEAAEYLTKVDWEETPIGGYWDWERDVFGIVAGVSVWRPERDDGQMQAIDALVDNGDISSGSFQKKSGRYTYIIEE